jgi:hypothetical protein
MATGPRCVRCSATWCFWRAHRPRPVSQSFLRCRRCPSRPSARGQAHLHKVARNPRSRVESRSARNRGVLFRNETARSPSIRTNGAGEMTCGCGIAEPLPWSGGSFVDVVRPIQHRPQADRAGHWTSLQQRRLQSVSQPLVPFRSHSRSSCGERFTRGRRSRARP